MNIQEIVTIIRKLSILAGREIMEVYASDDFGVDVKSDASPVTIADKRADALIFKGLQAAFPDIAVVTEEQAETHSKAHDRFFIVDPLDGTKEFIHKRGEFTVNIALVEEGIPVLGVVYAPAIGRLFITETGDHAVEELGPFDADVWGEKRPLAVTEKNEGALNIVASKSHRDAATEAYIGKYDVDEFKAAGSSLKFCLLASGEADLYPRLGRTMEWDTAAGHAVLRAAGGSVVRFDNHKDLIYGKDGFENPFFIASNGQVDLKSS